MFVSLFFVVVAFGIAGVGGGGGGLFEAQRSLTFLAFMVCAYSRLGAYSNKLCRFVRMIYVYLCWYVCICMYL